MSGGFGFGLFGLETPTSGIEDLILADETLSYEGQGILLVEYGTDPDDTEQITGDTSLTVDFATGDVTGDLIQTATSSIDLLNGTVTGNGFTGTIGASGDLGIILGVDEASVDASFYGGAAEEVGGTFEGTGTYAASPATFSGFFAGTQP